MKYEEEYKSLYEFGEIPVCCQVHPKLEGCLYFFIFLSF